MSIRIYEHMKNRYEKTKPIRGRSTDERPWGDRRRDAELIVQTTRALDGKVLYGAKLYDTVVFAVAPDGAITFRCDGWVSPTTTAFLHGVMRDYALGGAFRQYNSLWIRLYRHGNYMLQRIPPTGDLTLKYNVDTDKYETHPVIATKRLINRQAMKAMREKVRGFREYYRPLLKLSDGFVSAELIGKHAVVKHLERLRPHYPDYTLVEGFRFVIDGNALLITTRDGSVFRMNALLEMLCMNDERLYEPMLALVAHEIHHEMTGVCQVLSADGVEFTYSSKIVSVNNVDRWLTNLIKKTSDVWTLEKCEVTAPMKDVTYD